MAWYRIAENVLDAIADAINAKTGGTSPMTPVEMVLEIQSIPTGGGGEDLGFWKETVTAGANVAANTYQCVQYLLGLMVNRGNIVRSITRKSTSPSPAYSEFGGCGVYMNGGEASATTINATQICQRYRDQWANTSYGTNWDAIISPGSVFEIVVGGAVGGAEV